MNMVTVLYTRASGADVEIYDYPDSLIELIQRENRRFLNQTDRTRYLCGRIMIIEGLKKLGIVVSKDLVFLTDEFGRLRVGGIQDLDFNVSHSGDFVVCALSLNTRLGVDIEEMIEVDFNDLVDAMNDEEWLTITKSTCPLREFYRLWTKKECILKAVGKGFLMPIDEVVIDDRTATAANKTWHLTELFIDKSYSGCLATNRGEVNVRLLDFGLNTSSWD